MVNDPSGLKIIAFSPTPHFLSLSFLKDLYRKKRKQNVYGDEQEG